MTWLEAVAAGARALALMIGLAPLAAAAEHLVAVVATKGSPHQPYGEEIVAGAAVAIARINAAGGVNGEPMRLVAWGEDCTRDRATQIAEEIARLKPALVVGHLCAGAALAAAPIYAKAGVLLMVPGVRHPGLTSPAKPNAAPLILRLAGRDDRFAAETIRLVATRYPGRAVAIVADRTKQAKALASALAAEVARQQVVLALDDRIESAEKSYDAVAGRIKASGAGVVLVPAQPIELGILIASLRRYGVDAPIVGSEVLAVPSVTPTAQREAGRLVLMLPWTGAEGDLAKPTEGDEALHDEPRRAVRLRAEAAIEAWAGAARLARDSDPGKVAAAARAGPLPTVIGPIGFDEAGDALLPSYVAHVWRDGGWRPLGPAP